MTYSPVLLSLVVAGLCLQHVGSRPWSANDASSSSSSSSRHFVQSGQKRPARSGLSALQEKEVCESLRTVLSACYEDTTDKALTSVACKALMNAASSQAEEIGVDCDLSSPIPGNPPAFFSTRLCSAIQTVLFRAQCQSWQQENYSSRCVKIRNAAKFFTRHLKLKSCDIDGKPNATLPSSPASPTTTTTTEKATGSTSATTTTATTLPTAPATTATTPPQTSTTATTPLTTTTPTTPLTTTTPTTPLTTTTPTTPPEATTTTITTTTSDTTTTAPAEVNECLANRGECFTASRCDENWVAWGASCPGIGTICCKYL